MSFYCAAHRKPVADDSLRVLVDAEEQGSGGGIPIYACRPCVDRRNIRPFDNNLRPPLGHEPPPTGIRRAP